MRATRCFRTLYFGLLLCVTACGDCSDDGGDTAEDGGHTDGSIAGMGGGGSGGSTVDGSDPELDGSTTDDGSTPDAQTSDDAGPDGMDDGGDGDGDGGADSGEDADAASGVSLYVDPETGADTNPGTMAMPFKTIEHAASLAGDGDTIWLLDGTYDETTEPKFLGSDAATCGFYSGITLPQGVTVRAVNAGQAVLSVNAPHGFCMTGGALVGLDISHPNPGGRLVEISEGEVVITGTRFTNAGTGGGGNEAAIVATGTAQVTVRPGALTNLVGAPAYAYARAEDDSRVEIEGGTIAGTSSAGTSGNSVLVALENGEIVLDGVTIEQSAQPNAITMVGSSKVSLLNGTVLEGSSNALNGIHILGTSTLTIDDSSIQGYGSGIYANIYEATNPTIVATDAVLEANTYGMYLGGDTQPLVADVTITGGRIRNNTQRGVYSNVPGTYAFDGTEITGNGTRGLDFWNVANLYTVKLRNATVTGNGTSGVYVTGAAGSSLDLGTLADPGDNTFTGNNTAAAASEASVRISLASTTVHAVGNTWSVAQSANAQGQYSAAGAGAVVEFTTGTGPNFSIDAGTLRVAQNPL